MDQVVTLFVQMLLIMKKFLRIGAVQQLVRVVRVVQLTVRVVKVLLALQVLIVPALQVQADVFMIIVAAHLGMNPEDYL